MKKALLITLIILLSSCGSQDQQTEIAATVSATHTAIPSPTPTEDILDESLLNLPVSKGGFSSLPDGYTYFPASCGTEEPFSAPISSEYGLFLGWGTVEEEQIDDFLISAQIELSIDGEPENYDGRTSITFDDISAIYSVVIYKVIGSMEEGSHKIEQKIIFEDEYSDGVEMFGPGTEKEEITYTCEFIITEMD